MVGGSEAPPLARAIEKAETGYAVMIKVWTNMPEYRPVYAIWFLLGMQDGVLEKCSDALCAPEHRYNICISIM